MQPNAISVQAHLNSCLTTLLQEPVNVVGAGRTDTGVHAREMVAHMDLSRSISDIPRSLNGLNKMLGPDVAVKEIFPVSDHYHARFDAIERHYEYHLCRKKDPFLQNLAAQLRYPLDEEAVLEATALLPGRRDFSSFSKSRTQTRTKICDLRQAHWELSEGYWVFHVSADRFLRNMVRAMVGSLLEVGRRRMTVRQFAEMLEAKDRRLAGESAPAQGLYLTKIVYPKSVFEWQNQ